MRGRGEGPRSLDTNIDLIILLAIALQLYQVETGSSGSV